MTILDENGISFEEHIDDLLLENDIHVFDWDFGTKNTAIAFIVNGRKYVAMKSCIDEDARVCAKMHEFEHHRLEAYYTLESKARERERAEAKIRRAMIRDFLTPEYLIKLIRRENTFNARALAEVTNFSADLIEEAEDYYFNVKGIKPPVIEDIYNE